MTRLNPHSISERKAVDFARSPVRKRGADRGFFNWRGFIALLEAFRATGGSAPGEIVELPPLWSGWDLAVWFALPKPPLNGCRPVDLLDSDLEGVLRAAQSLGSVDSHGLPPLRRAHEVAAHL